MYNRDLVATSDSRLTLVCNGSSKTVDLYSQQGLEMVAGLWTKLGCEYRLMYEPTWLGLPIIQFPSDIVMMQELIWKVRPDVIVESGLAHGGSAVLYASLCELMGKGRVIGIDVEVREHNRLAIQDHPLSKRIDIIEGSSVDPRTVASVSQKVADAGTVLVVLDSNHSHEHVLKELTLYHSMVTPGSYLVAMDGAQAHVWDVPRAKPHWRQDHPMTAIHEFLREHPEFRIDPRYTRLHVTSNPDGYLRRLTEEEIRVK